MALKNSKILTPIKKIVKTRMKEMEHKKKFNKPFFFLNNSKGNETACFILSGYKEFTWDIVYKRIKTFCPENIDVCIVSSGLYSDKLLEIANNYGWSYISMKRNNVCLALNSAIKEFSHANKIFKLDEDIFITEGFFDKLPATFEKAKNDYNPGFAAPLLLINGFCYRTILEKLNLVDLYSNKFEYPKIAAGPSMMIESNLDTAKFMWGEGNYIPKIDKLNELFRDDSSFQVCPIRFSIGAIYFERSLLEQFNYFPVSKGNDMGKDEEFLCNLATTYSKSILVSNNSLVGHLSFGKQNEGMKDYYLSNKDVFDI